MSEQEQAVATKTDAGAEPPAEGASGAQEETLDALLAEYDSTVKGEEPKPETKDDASQGEKPKEQNIDVRSAVEAALREREVRQKVDEDLKKTVQDFKGEDLKHVADDIVEAFLDLKARKDPRLADAWAKRNQSPEKWNKIVSSLNAEFRSLAGLSVDRDQTETVDSVVAAVRGASTKTASVQNALTNKDVGSLSDAEFAQLKASL